MDILFFTILDAMASAFNLRLNKSYSVKTCWTTIVYMLPGPILQGVHNDVAMSKKDNVN